MECIYSMYIGCLFYYTVYYLPILCILYLLGVRGECIFFVACHSLYYAL